MKELFIINDYDTGEPTEFYITDNARGCAEALDDVELIRNYFDDEDEDDRIKELKEELGIRKFNKILRYAEDCWQDAFEVLCKSRGIKLEQPDDIETYEF